MPRVWPITALAFPQLFTDLGIQAVPSAPQWWLSDTVQPVSLVDSQIVAPVEARIPLYLQGQIQASALIAPVINTVVVDTGALQAGDFDIQVLATLRASVLTTISFEHRNAANSASLFTHHMLYGTTTLAAVVNTFIYAVRILLNERFIVVIREANLGASDRISAIIVARARS